MDRQAEQRPSPWHAGERMLQQAHHVADRMEALGQRVIRDYMPDQHREFFHRLPFMVVGAVDSANRPWATLLEGPQGFVTSADPCHLLLAVHPDPQDPAASGLQAGQAIGMLGIELPTRRRNRINGGIRRVSAAGIEVRVEQSFGNCPKYIQARACIREPRPADGKPPRRDSDGLDEWGRALIRAADTFFVASYVDQADGTRAVDVSHRGGRGGFVRVDGNRLTVPDYAGNLFFNTLGNLLANPVAGLLFIDFASGDLLQLSGRAELLADSPLVEAFVGAERLWAFEVERVVVRPAATALRGQLLDPASANLAAGARDAADARQSAGTDPATRRP